MKTELTMKQVLEHIIADIQNGRYHAAINLAQDCVDEMYAKEEESDGA